MKILNLFAGIGGNRTLWGNEHEITAIEYDQKIAILYQKEFPNDEIIIGDAYEYFLKYFKDFDLIWASPPCQSHSRLVRTNISQGQGIKYPDLRLYELIIFCQNFCKSFYIIENIIPYYKPLIRPTIKLGRHLIWTNIPIQPLKIKKFDFSKCNGGTGSSPKYMKNRINPKIAKYILDSINTKTLEDFI